MSNPFDASAFNHTRLNLVGPAGPELGERDRGRGAVRARQARPRHIGGDAYRRRAGTAGAVPTAAKAGARHDRGHRREPRRGRPIAADTPLRREQ
jgi:hypothetical protein